MKTSRLCLGIAVVAVVIGLFTAPATAHADTYQIYHLINGSNSPFFFTFPVGVTDSGLAVVSVDPVDCGGTPGHCYETFFKGTVIGQSRTNPGLAYDNGTPCTPDTPLSGPFADSVCNNGREVYGTLTSPAYPFNSIFTGRDPVADFFAGGLLDSVYLNSSGDFVYWVNNVGGYSGDVYEAIDLTLPEFPNPAVSCSWALACSPR